MAISPQALAGVTAPVHASNKPPWYRVLWVQVFIAIALAVVLGYFDPARAVSMKALGDAFIRLITSIITLIVFCTVTTGIARMENLKKVGRVGGMALLYFEVVSTLALLIGIVVGNVVRPGDGFNVSVATLDAKAVADYAGQAKAQNVTDFLMHVIPTTVVDAFTKGDILQVVFVSLLFGFALSTAGARAKPLVDMIDSLTNVVFEVTRILMKFAPIGAFGAMAYTVGKFGLASLGPLARRRTMSAPSGRRSASHFKSSTQSASSSGGTPDTRPLGGFGSSVFFCASTSSGDPTNGSSPTSDS